MAFSLFTFSIFSFSISFLYFFYILSLFFFYSFSTLSNSFSLLYILLNGHRRWPYSRKASFLVTGAGPEVDIAILGILVDLLELIIGEDQVVQCTYILLDLKRGACSDEH